MASERDKDFDFDPANLDSPVLDKSEEAKRKAKVKLESTKRATAKRKEKRKRDETSKGKAQNFDRDEDAFVLDKEEEANRTAQVKQQKTKRATAKRQEKRLQQKVERNFQQAMREPNNPDITTALQAAAKVTQQANENATHTLDDLKEAEDKTMQAHD